MSRPASDPAALAMLASLYPGSVAVLSGLPHTGKTSLAVDASGRWPRWVCFHPYAHLQQSSSRRRVPWAGRQVSPAELIADPAILSARRLSLVVAPATLNDGYLARDFATVAELCWHTGGLVLIAEEASLYGQRAVQIMRRVATGGGHVDLAFVLLSQSLGELTVKVRRQVSHRVMLGQSDPADMREIRERCGKETEARVKAWTPGQPPILWQAGAVHG